MSVVAQRHLFVFSTDAEPSEVASFLMTLCNNDFTTYPFAFMWNDEMHLIADVYDLVVFYTAFCKEHQVQ